MRRLILPLLWMILGGLIVLSVQQIDVVSDGAVAPAPAGPSPEAAGPGAIAMPVPGVDPATLGSNFGEARDGGARSHGAIDIAAPRGAAVVAAAPGTVEKIFESGAGGHTVYVRSPDRGTVYYYAHLGGYADGLREGLYLAQGAPIGTVGTSGNAEGGAPHLHFEVKRMAPGEAWHQGTAIDPHPLLAGASASR